MSEMVKNRLLDSLPAPEKGLMAKAYDAAESIQRTCDHPELDEEDRLARAFLEGAEWNHGVTGSMICEALGGIAEVSS